MEHPTAVPEMQRKEAHEADGLQRELMGERINPTTPGVNPAVELLLYDDLRWKIEDNRVVYYSAAYDRWIVLDWSGVE